MISRRAKRLFCLLFLPVFALGSQESDTAFSGLGVPPAPVVSSLSATVQDGSVGLRWSAAPGIRGKSEILRAAFPITAANEASAEVRGTVDWNVTEFVDSLESGQEYWYAVVSIDADGTRYAFFLPASNSLILPVSAEPQTVAVSADIDSFSLRIRNDAIIATWNETSREKNLVLYRSTEPFTAFSSLLRAVLVSVISDRGNTFTDYPVPGVPFYYALLDEDDVHTGTVAFADGKNTNAVPVEIPSELAVIQRASVQPVRPMPLPLLNPTMEPALPAHVFSRGTEAKIASLAGASRPTVKAQVPYVFRSDLESQSSSGDDYALRKIVADGFKSEKITATLAALDEYLSLRRGDQAAARARFYRGEALYFSGKYEDALLEFLLARDIYANQAGEWIQYTLGALTAEGR